MRKTLIAVVFLAAGVGIANAQSTEKAKKEKKDIKAKKEVKAEVVVEMDTTPSIQYETATMKKPLESSAIKKETAVELKQFDAVKLDEKK